MSTTNGSKPVAVITGASSGFGVQIAEQLAAGGYRVALLARSADKLSALATKLNDAGHEALATPADVTDRAAVKAAVQQAVDHFGRVDVMVNNAGIMPLSFMKNLHEDEWEQMVDVNIKGVLNGVGAVLPFFTEQKSGHIINVTSVAGIKVMMSGAVYSGTKYAVEAISEGLRQELTKSHNIRVTSIRPGAFATNLTSTITDPEVHEMFKGMAGEIEFQDPIHVANAVVYAVEQPESVSVSHVTIRPTSQVM